MIKYKYIFEIQYTEAIFSDSTKKLLWFEISKMLIAVKKNKFIVLFVIIFRTLLSPIRNKKTQWDSIAEVTSFVLFRM